MGKVLFFFSLLSKIVEKLFEENLDTKGEGGPRGGDDSSTALPSNAELRAEGQNHCSCAINNAGQVFGFLGQSLNKRRQDVPLDLDSRRRRRPMFSP